MPDTVYNDTRIRHMPETDALTILVVNRGDNYAQAAKMEKSLLPSQQQPFRSS